MQKYFLGTSDTEAMMSRRPRLAATVILLRPAKPRGFEVFLTRRPQTMPFLSGMYCFPGGAMRKEDRSEAIARLCSGLSANDARRILGAHFSFREALGLWVTAIRELFEEAGILLASREASGRRIIATLTEAQLSERHAALLNHSSSFRSLLESTKLLCDMTALDHFSHWQTPPELPMRFDTHFFLARLPEGQNPLATSPEVEHSLWLTPDHALQMFSRNELPIIFPTFASLRTLADFETLASVQKEFGAAQ